MSLTDFFLQNPSPQGEQQKKASQITVFRQGLTLSLILRRDEQMSSQFLFISHQIATEVISMLDKHRP